MLDKKISYWKLFIILLVVKTLAGWGYGYIMKTQYNGADTFEYYRKGVYLAQLAATDPDQYFRLIFGPIGGNIPDEIADHVARIGYWDSTGSYFMNRVSGIFALLSFQNYWGMVFLLNILVSGSLLLLLKTFWGSPSTLKGLISIGLPSLIFWTSGFHKDAWILMGIIWMVFGCFHFFRSYQWYYLICILAGSFLLLQIRDFVWIILVGMLVVYAVINRYKLHAFLSYLIISLIGILMVAFINPSLGENTVLEKFKISQEKFITESVGVGKSFHPTDWDPTAEAFLQMLPEASINAFFRPFLTESQSLIQWVSSIETLVVFLGLLGLLLYRKGCLGYETSLLLFFALANLILIGYLVANSGTLTRYRSIYLGLIWMILVLEIKKPLVDTKG